MKRSPLSAQGLQRLKWIIVFISVSVILISEYFHYSYQLNRNIHLIIGVTGSLLALTAILWTFNQAERVRIQLDHQLQRTRQLARRQSILLKLNTKVAGQLDETTIARILLIELDKTLGYHQATLKLYDEAGNFQGEIRQPSQPGESFRTASDQDREDRKITDHAEIMLEVSGKRVGCLIIWPPAEQPGWSEDLSVVEAAANQAALAIANARLVDEQRRRAINAQKQETELRHRERYLTRLNELSQITLRSQDLSTMLQALADQLGIIFQADSVLITLWDSKREKVVPTTAYGPLRRVVRTLQIEPADLPLTNLVLEKRGVEAIEDVAATPLISGRLAALLQSRSILALPLLVGDEKLGIVILIYKQRHGFSEDEINLGEQAAFHISLAVAKVQALETAQYRAQELGALQQATGALLSTLDLETLLGQILDAALSAIPAAEKGRLHLIARETGELQTRAVHGYSDPRIHRFRSTDQTGIPARAVRQRKPLLVHDTYSDSEHMNGSDLPEVRAIASMIVAPLIYGSEVLGAISLEAFTRYAFSETDLQLLDSFAATATTVLQNAQLHAEVQRQAITDSLTRIYNRRGFFELGWREVERARRFARPLAALMLDLDDFKEVNDRYGHPTGDRVLVSVATQLRHELRQIDLVGRYGGDEFCVLLPETALGSAEQAAERLRRRLAQTEFEQGIRVHFSIGVAALDQTNHSLEKLIANADAALYSAKQGGKNIVMSSGGHSTD